MTVTQTVDIPANRRLIIDVPSELPAGRAILTFTPARDAAERLAASPANRERLYRANAEQGKNLITFENLEQAIQFAEEQAAEIYVDGNNPRDKMSLNDILKLRGKYAGYISVEKFLEQKRKDIELE